MPPKPFNIFQGFEYDAILRSDLDTFLIPGFADWLPPSADKIAVGTGGYGSENANAHLNYVSQKLGLRNKVLLWTTQLIIIIACVCSAIASRPWQLLVRTLEANEIDCEADLRSEGFEHET